MADEEGEISQVSVFLCPMNFALKFNQKMNSANFLIKGLYSDAIVEVKTCFQVNILIHKLVKY